MICAICHNETPAGEIIPGGFRCPDCAARVRSVIDEARVLAEEARAQLLLSMEIEAACAVRQTRDPGRLPEMPLRGEQPEALTDWALPLPSEGCWEQGAVEEKGWTWRDGADWRRDRVDTRSWAFVRHVPCACGHLTWVLVTTQAQYDREAKLLGGRLCAECWHADPSNYARARAHCEWARLLGAFG